MIRLAKLAGSIEQRRYLWLFAVMAAAAVIANFQQVGLASVAGNVADSLQVDMAELGLVTAAFSYAYGAMQIPAGLLADTLGPRKSVSIALLLAALGTGLFALAQSTGMAICARALIGMGLAVVAVPQMKLIAVWFPASAYSRLVSLAFALSTLGLVMATSPMAYVSAAFGWRASFAAIAGLTLLAGLLVWLIVRDAPPAGAALGGRGRKAGGSLRVLLKNLGRIVGTREIWLLGFWLFCQAGAFFALVGLWGGEYLRRGLGLSSEESGWILLLAACSMATSPFFSWLAEKLGSIRRVLILLSCGSVGLAAPMVAGLDGLSEMLLSLYFLAFAVMTFGGGVLIFVAAKERFPIDLAGSVSGFINIFTFAGGACVQQGMGLCVELLHGWGLDYKTAISRAFGIMFAAALLSLILAVKYRDFSEDGGESAETPGPLAMFF